MEDKVPGQARKLAEEDGGKEDAAMLMKVQIVVMRQLLPVVFVEGLTVS